MSPFRCTSEVWQTEGMDDRSFDFPSDATSDDLNRASSHMCRCLIGVLPGNYTASGATKMFSYPGNR